MTVYDFIVHTLLPTVKVDKHKQHKQNKHKPKQNINQVKSMKVNKILKHMSVMGLLSLLITYNVNATAPTGYTLTWEDAFSGSTLNTTNWTIGLRDYNSWDLVPGADGDYLLNTGYMGYITPEDVVVSGGYLTLLNQKRTYVGTSPSGTYSYTSGSVMSMHKVYFNGGGSQGIYLEWRAKFPSGSKVWPALWLIAEDLVWCPEWDCFEYFGYKASVGYDMMGMHLCYDAYPNQQWMTGSGYVTNYDATYNCEAWHTYGFEWTSTYAKWTIDGVQTRYMSNTIGTSWPNKDCYIVMNNGLGTTYPDSGNTVYPNSLVIDYVRLYKASSVLANGTYSLQNRTSGKVLDNLSSTSNGANVGQWTDGTSNNQKWTVSTTGSYRKLKCASSGKYLDSYGHTGNGSTVTQNASSTSNNQQWTITSAGNGYYYVINRANGLYLDSAGSTADGAIMVFWSSTASNNQQWQFVSP
jgi:hypothetical protein